MSEHIKTGGQIRKELKKADFLKDKSLWLHLNSKQWVSLSWLKEQIESKINSYSGISPVNHAIQSGLNDVLSLLEEK